MSKVRALLFTEGVAEPSSQVWVFLFYFIFKQLRALMHSTRLVPVSEPGILLYLALALLLK